MRYKHKFYMIDKLHNNEKNELAIISDEMTANVLADHYRNIYENKSNGIEIVYRYKQKEKIIVHATFDN